MMATSKLVAKRPPSGKLRDWRPPTVTRTRLSSGMQVLTVNAPGRLVGTAQLILEAGPSNEDRDQAGIAYIAARALTEGTDKLKGGSFVETVETLGADIFSSVDYDVMTIQLRAPIDRFEPALELLADAVLRPSFSGGDLDRLRKERMGGIMQEYASAASRASIAFDKAVYSKDSLYARSAMGDYWSVAQLAKGKVKKYYERYATPGSASLIVAGDVEGMPIAKIAEKLFGGWKGKEPDRFDPVVEESVGRTFIYIVDKPEAKQSHIQIGHMGVPRSNPDYLALTALSTALGSSADSRLSNRIREEKGYTYGISGQFEFRRGAGPFRVSTPVETAVTVDAVKETLKVLDETKADGITAKELVKVKGFLTGVLLVRFESSDGIASAIHSQVKYGLPDDYYETYRDQVEALTLDEVNAATRYLRDHRAIVVVGDAEEIREPLIDADIGPVAVVEDPDNGEPPTD